MKRTIFNFLPVIFIFLTAELLFPGVPALINYQGKLLQNGVPYSGNENIIFNIYDAAAAGTLIWAGDVQVVKVTNGIFHTYIGASTATGSPRPFTNIDWSGSGMYLEIRIGGDTLQPREKINSVSYSLLSRRSELVDWSGILNKPSSVIPSGVILMWSGTIASIPSGWVLCDGSSGTPDLRDRFILSVSSSAENPGATGGSHSKSLVTANLPAHTHYISGGTGNQSQDHSHSGSTSSDGNHVHALKGEAGPEGGGAPEQGSWGGGYTDAQTSENGNHSHSVSTGGASQNHSHSISFDSGPAGSGTSFDGRPAFFKLAFIMKL
ncbi:MAG: hypothetical protein PHF84_04120 [bacterium]|nr:hypothetical protein [bacterium]